LPPCDLRHACCRSTGSSPDSRWRSCYARNRKPHPGQFAGFLRAIGNDAGPAFLWTVLGSFRCYRRCLRRRCARRNPLSAACQVSCATGFKPCHQDRRSMELLPGVLEGAWNRTSGQCCYSGNYGQGWQSPVDSADYRQSFRYNNQSRFISAGAERMEGDTHAAVSIDPHSRYFIRVQASAPETLLPGWQNFNVSAKSGNQTIGTVPIRVELSSGWVAPQ